jgi:FkbM family methyltransferase
MRLVLAAVLRADSCCVDVGANVGAFLEQCVALAPHGRHVAYEPLPDLAADLAARFRGVDVRARAVSDGRRTETFTRVIDRPTRSGLGERGDEDGATERLSVDVVDLDSDLPPGLVPALVKLDVEGTEALAVRGAAETLRRHRPVVLFEHGWADWCGDLHAELAGLDMDVFDLAGRGPLDRDAFVAAVRGGDAINFLARHRAA